MLPTEIKRLKLLEDENGRLKKIAADLTLDREGRNINIKKVYRIYIGSRGPSYCDASPQDGMQLRNKMQKQRVKAKLRDNSAEAVGPQ